MPVKTDTRDQIVASYFYCNDQLCIVGIEIDSENRKPFACTRQITVISTSGCRLALPKLYGNKMYVYETG